ncbi:MAG TPA: asparagine synthase (glutamine-hydrolyzing) [Kineosporiaceae bacterium]
MCGIAGVVDLAAAVRPGALARMLASLAHRGPDGEGTYESPSVALGSTRLAIVDPLHGEQPVFDESHRVVAVFNGELYNHRALAADLRQRGHLLRTRCDSETLPHLYELYQERLASHLDGDFAFAIWDAETSCLVLGRDRTGVKPLYYLAEGSRVVFASEVKALVASGYYDPSPSHQGLLETLSYGQPLAANSFWQGVQQVGPGETLRFSAAGLRRWTYWRPFEREDPEAPFLRGRAAIERFRSTFVEAIRKRLPDEVAWGVTLSGGLDSTSIASVASREFGADMPTCSIRLPGEKLDEGTYSRAASRELGLVNIEVSTDAGEMHDLLPETLWHLETPQWFGVAPPFLKVAETARQHGVKVALTGDGADELLAGYSMYRILTIQRRLRRLGLDGAAAPLWQRAARLVGAPSDVGAEFRAVNHSMRDVTDSMPAWSYIWISMQKQAADALVDYRALGPPTLPTPPQPLDELRRSLYAEYFTRLPNWILVLSDRLSMARGVEVRVPFMDRDLLDLVADLDPRLILHLGTEKYVLKEAMRSTVPEAVRRRRKKPFFTPVHRWFLGGELAANYLSAQTVREHGLFRPAAVDRLRAIARDEERTWASITAGWTCLMIMSTHILVEQFTDSRTRALADPAHPGGTGRHAPAGLAAPLSQG